MFTHISNQTSMNPTGDRLTAELQQTTHIDPPVVVGQGEKTTLTEKLVSGVEKTGQKIGEGFDTIVSGVEKTGQKLVSGVEYTGEKLKATGELIGEKLGETLAVTGDKISDVVSEEKVELPGVVTLLQSGAARIFGHLTGSVTKTAPPAEHLVPPAPTFPILPDLKASTSPILPDLKSDTEKTIVHAEKNLSGDIITTNVQSGHLVEKPASRVDIMIQSGQLGPQSELHLPNLKVPDMPLNRAIEEPLPIPQDTELPSLTQTEVQDGAQFIDTVEQKITETVQAQSFPSFVYVHPQPIEQSLDEQKVDNQKHQLPSLTSRTVLDGAEFIEKAELQIGNIQSKDVGSKAEQLPKEQLPNLTAKAVHDGATFIDQAEQQKKSKSKGTVNQSVDSMLPSLSTKDVHDGVMFLDVVENSNQSM